MIVDWMKIKVRNLKSGWNTQKIRAVAFRGGYLDRAALDALLAHAKSATSHEDGAMLRALSNHSSYISPTGDA